MTIQEFYDWAKENNALEAEMLYSYYVYSKFDNPEDIRYGVVNEPKLYECTPLLDKNGNSIDSGKVVEVNECSQWEEVCHDTE